MSDQKGNRFRSFLDAASTALLDLALGPPASELLTNVIGNVVYDVIKERFGLTQEEQEDIRKRAHQASAHLVEAGKILTELQSELNRRDLELEMLLADIDIRRAEAEHWQQIASTNEKLASALTKEIERRVREQIRAELERSKTRRQVLGAIMWVVTLLVGGIVGAAIQQWWQTGSFLK